MKASTLDKFFRARRKLERMTDEQLDEVIGTEVDPYAEAWRVIAQAGVKQAMNAAIVSFSLALLGSESGLAVGRTKNSLASLDACIDYTLRALDLPHLRFDFFDESVVEREVCDVQLVGQRLFLTLTDVAYVNGERYQVPPLTAEEWDA